jgi:hypothetical protein
VEREVHRRRRRWARFVLLPIALGGLSVTTVAHAESSVRVVSSMVKVMPDRPLPSGAESARLEAARGEWEPFQIALAGPMRGVRAEATVLRRPRGATLPSPRLHRVELVEVKTPSSIEGRAGRWPDALVPDVDAYVGERRNAFPFDVSGGETRAIWVDVFVPRDAVPGAYRGEIVVRSDGRADIRVPVALIVHRFALPATSSLPVTFGISYGAIARGHGLPREGIEALGARYGVAALRHRVSLHGGSMEPPSFRRRSDGSIELDTRAYDAEVGPLLDGCADRGGPAERAKATLVDLRVPARLDGEVRDAYVRAMVEHLRARGWLARAFDYTFDEPKPERYGEVRRRAERLRAATTEIPRFTPRRAAVQTATCGTAPLLVPVVPQPRLRHRRRRALHRLAEPRRRRAGGRAPHPRVAHLPRAHRRRALLQHRRGVGQAGDRSLARPRLHGGNGDGTPFYPGTPPRIGGRTHVPVESIRLSLVREGLEDYEYLRLYERAAGRAAAEALATRIAPKASSWEHDGERLLEARREMARAIDAAVARGEIAIDNKSKVAQCALATSR